jgi:2,3-bisphosphoglycerate-independent phosphoglycerate mutase
MLPKRFLVAPPEIERTLGEYLVHNDVHQLAISETQKFGHVTYFWNGNRSGMIDARASSTSRSRATRCRSRSGRG